MILREITSNDIDILLDDSITEIDAIQSGIVFKRESLEKLREYWNAFAVEHNNELVAIFAIRENNGAQVSRMYLLKKWRGILVNGNPACWHLATQSIAKAQELFPGQRVWGSVIDAVIKGVDYPSKAAPCWESAGVYHTGETKVKDYPNDDITLTIKIYEVV